MLAYTEALETVLNNIRTLNVEEKALTEAQGQVLAEDIYSDYNLPMRDTSGPDGYAVRAKDIEQVDKNNPVTLQIIETVRAGYLPQEAVSPGTAIRIMTGSVVPDGADCVVRFEDTDEPENKSGPNLDNPTHVKIYVSQAPGTSVFKAGGNIRKGALLMPKNTVIGTAQLAALITIGKKSVKVIRRPKVAVITTGDELVKVGTPLTAGKAYDSNEATVQSLVTHYGCTPWVLGIARDNEKSLFDKMREGLAADMVITTGGVSKGDYDLVRQVIGKLGRLVFFRVKMGPGAALAFGLAEKSSKEKEHTTVPILALSGTPQGCLVNLETLVRPALLKMRGVQELSHPAVVAVSEESITNARPISFVSWTVLKRTDAGYKVTQNNSKGPLAQISTANSLTMIPAGTEIKAGEKISVWPLDWTSY
jgi:molybdopterin molybdotransferase